MIFVVWPLAVFRYFLLVCLVFLGCQLVGWCGEVLGDVVSAEDEGVCDFECFLEACLGGFSVGAFEDLSCFEVFDCWDCVAADECGCCGF